MTRRSVVIAAPRRIEIETGTVPAPAPGSDAVLVRCLVSAISAGTELHFYRGDLAEASGSMPLDEALPSLSGELRYPLCYGYAAVGERAEDGRRVFCHHPHESHFLARPEDLYELPQGLDAEAAALWPSVETAVNLTLDAAPLVGERVLVVGQGVVGLATTFVLSHMPLERLWTVEPAEIRRNASMRLGAERALTPGEAAEAARSFDLAIELSGSTEGLSAAIDAVGYEGRVVVGSWFSGAAGLDPVALGTHFHRGRIAIVSSQVSRLGSPLQGRWDKARRMATAARMLETLPAREIVTHRFPVERAGEAFSLLDASPDSCLQVLLTYT